MFNWLRRTPPEPYSQEYGVVYNARKHRWELCSAQAACAVVRITVPTWRASRQGELLTEYDSFTHYLKEKVSDAKWLRARSLPHVQEPE